MRCCWLYEIWQSSRLRGPDRVSAVPAVGFGWDVGHLLLRKQIGRSLMIASRGEPAIYSIRFFGRRRQCIIVALSLEDTRPWFSLFIAIDGHKPFPLPPIDVSDQSDACVHAGPPRSEDARTDVLALLFALSGNEGSAQDALTGCLSPRRSN